MLLSNFWSTTLPLMVCFLRYFWRYFFYWKNTVVWIFFFVIFTQLFVIFVFFKLRFYSHSCAVFVPDDKMGNGKRWQRSNKHLLVFLKYNTTNICPGHEACPFECGFTNCEENLTEASVLCLNLTKKVNFFFSSNNTLWGTLEEPNIVNANEFEDLFSKATQQTKKKPLADTYEKKAKTKKVSSVAPPSGLTSHRP